MIIFFPFSITSESSCTPSLESGAEPSGQLYFFVVHRLHEMALTIVTARFRNVMPERVDTDEAEAYGPPRQSSTQPASSTRRFPPSRAKTTFEPEAPHLVVMVQGYVEDLLTPHHREPK